MLVRAAAREHSNYWCVLLYRQVLRTFLKLKTETVHFLYLPLHVFVFVQGPICIASNPDQKVTKKKEKEEKKKKEISEDYSIRDVHTRIREDQRQKYQYSFGRGRSGILSSLHNVTLPRCLVTFIANYIILPDLPTVIHFALKRYKNTVLRQCYRVNGLLFRCTALWVLQFWGWGWEHECS